MKAKFLERIQNNVFVEHRGYDLTFVGGNEEAAESCEEYAKQQMKEFAEWIQDNYSTNGMSGDWWKNSRQYSTDQLIQEFLNK